MSHIKLIDYSKNFAKERPILFSVLFCFLFSFLVFFAALLIRTGSILIPVIWHALGDFPQIISQYIDPGKYLEKLAANTESAGAASALIIFILFSAIGIFLIRKEISQSFSQKNDVREQLRG